MTLTYKNGVQDEISIHALRVEGDDRSARAWAKKVTISIHALRVEGDSLPIRFAFRCRYFYPRPPGGGRPDIIMDEMQNATISIHALRVEGDLF